MNNNSNCRTAVLLINLGTPDKPEEKEVREYLKEFLSDKDVIRMPRVIWLPILYTFILPFRSKKSAELYKQVWTKRGSPLLFNTYDQAECLQKKMNKNYPEKYHIEFAMRYGKPSIDSVIKKLESFGYKKIIYIPLFPQYSTTTTLSIFKKICEYKKLFTNYKFVSDFHKHNVYIQALSNKIKRFQEENGNPDKLLFSYHGIPKSYIGPDEPYEAQCYKTSELIAKQLKIQKQDYEVVFQSRLGKSEWLKPYLSERLKELPNHGVKNIQVFCPGFVSDCLETLEEVGEEAKDTFLDSNGEKYNFINCLNNHDSFIDVLEDIIINQEKEF